MNLDLLAIDDFAFKTLSQQNAEFLYSIVDARYQKSLKTLDSLKKSLYYTAQAQYR